LLAKTIFASPVFSTENTGFFHLLAKTCQPWCSAENIAGKIESDHDFELQLSHVNCALFAIAEIGLSAHLPVA